ncbi:Uncharacterised protein [Burkholderia cepacia]|uniref:Uncharacterized protein n=2 Tax=Burkholderia cepacia TaxID=292 RepID=A0AAE8NFJ2_BURCE|nr:Uncharacterised protein [Burkholderia cepacia]
MNCSSVCHYLVSSSPRLTKPMNRSDLPSFAACFYLFNAASVCQAFYWAYALNRMSVIPGSTLSVTMQWSVIGGQGLLGVVAAVMLLRRLAWTKHFLLAQLIIGNGLNVLTHKQPIFLMLTGALFSAIPLLIVVRIPIQERAPSHSVSTVSQRIQRNCGLGLYGLASYLMFGTLSALFTGTSRTVSSSAMRTPAAAVELICWLLLMLVGGAIFGQRAKAQRWAGILLTALASYMVLFCCVSYVYARTLYPQVEGLFHWDATLQWLVILAMTGFTLVGLSDGGKSSRSA